MTIIIIKQKKPQTIRDKKTKQKQENIPLFC